MLTSTASVGYALLIVGLFWLDRERRDRTSAALWLPLFWVCLACSRSVTEWLAGAQATASSPSADQYPGDASDVDRWVYTILLAGGFLVLSRRRTRVLRLLRENGPILAFLAYCVVSLMWSDYPGIAFKRWTKAIGDFVMVLIVWSDPRPLIALKRLLARATYLLIPLSVLFIKYYPELGRGYGRWDWKTFYTGVTTNKNTLGVICLLFGLGAVWRFLTDWQRRREPGRWRPLAASGTILAMVLWLFWMANSMSSLASFLVSGALLFVARSRMAARNPGVLHLVVFSELATYVGILFFGAGGGLLGNIIQRDTTTLTDRTEVWRQVLNLCKDPIVGTGFESFWLGPRREIMWSVYSWRPNEAHNGYIEVFANLGWLGVVLLAIVIVTGYRTVIAAWRRDPGGVGSLRLAYFMAGVVYNLTEAAFFRMMAPAWIIYLLAITRAPREKASGNTDHLPEAAQEFAENLAKC